MMKKPANRGTRAKAGRAGVLAGMPRQAYVKEKGAGTGSKAAKTLRKVRTEMSLLDSAIYKSLVTFLTRVFLAEW